MQGLELCRSYYLEYGAPMMHEFFSDLEEIIPAALTGSGSECYGFDDAVSRDHDFEPGFSLFLPSEEIIDRKTAFRLERAYAKLPAEYMGVPRLKVAPAGGSRHGVMRTEDHFRRLLGCMPDEMTPAAWLRVPYPMLAEAVNGEVFRDDIGLLTDQRAVLARMPEDILRKRLSGHLLAVARDGQYNYARCIAHGETGAAQLSVFGFADNAVSALFLLCGRYRPYYKWCFRSLRLSEDYAETADDLETLISSPNGPADTDRKIALLEKVTLFILDRLGDSGLTRATCTDPEQHAYSVNDGIRDGALRNLNIDL